MLDKHFNTSIARVSRFSAPKPFLCYADASGAGHIGVVSLVGGERLCARTHIPRWPLEDKAGIFEHELAAAFFGVCGVNVRVELAGRGVLR